MYPLARAFSACYCITSPSSTPGELGLRPTALHTPPTYFSRDAAVPVYRLKTEIETNTESQQRSLSGQEAEMAPELKFC